jgi:hypothetical protein
METIASIKHPLVIEARGLLSSRGQSGAGKCQLKGREASRGFVFRSSLIKCNSPQQAAALLRQKGFCIVATSPHAQKIQGRQKLPARPLALNFAGRIHRNCAGMLGNKTGDPSMPAQG